MNNVYIFGEITSESSKEAIKSIFEADEKIEPIDIYLNSIGGLVDDGLAIYDAINLLKQEVRIYATGYCASMAITILLSVPKERRFCTKNSRFMLHNTIVDGFRGNLAEIKDECKILNLYDEWQAKLISVETGNNLGEVIDRLKDEIKLDAEQALAYGLIGAIL